MDFREQARVLRSRWLLIAAIVAVGLAALALFGRGPKPKYTATSTLAFQESGNPPRDAYIQDLTAAAALARTSLVATNVAAKLNATNTPRDLADRIVVHADPARNTIVITANPYPSAVKVQRLADTFGDQLAASLADQQADLASRA